MNRLMLCWTWLILMMFPHDGLLLLQSACTEDFLLDGRLGCLTGGVSHDGASVMADLLLLLLLLSDRRVPKALLLGLWEEHGGDADGLNLMAMNLGITVQEVRWWVGGWGWVCRGVGGWRWGWGWVGTIGMGLV
jgi:hypothetical protein